MGDKYPELMDAYKKETSKRVSERILAVCHVLVDGIKVAEVARRFRKVPNTIRNLCRRFKERGIEGLHDAPRSGRPPKIKNETLDKYIGDTSAGVVLRILRDRVLKDFKVAYSASGLRAKAHSMSMSYKRPQPVYRKRADPREVITWCVVTAEWLDELEKDGFDACVVDQHRVENDYSPSRRAWSKVGTPIMSWKYPHRSHFYMFGGITISGKQLFRNIGKYTAENVLKVVKEMHRKWGQFGIVWDRASQHTACIVTDYLADHASDIRSWPLPVAWPGRNPVEGYWGNLEMHPVMYKQFETVDERVKGIMGTVRHLKANLDIRHIMVDSPVVDRTPDGTTTYEIESITQEPPSAAEIEACKNFLT